MHTPEKQRFLALKESLQTMDCEILVTLQGFADTYDEDGDMDDDMIAVGTTSPTETLQSPPGTPGPPGCRRAQGGTC